MIKCALLSVSDKTGLESFARNLDALGYRLLATGGTAICLKKAGISYVDVSDYTGLAEMLDGRVKTLHPKIHAGILYRRDFAEDVDQINASEIWSIDLVCVNFYPFKEKAVNAKLTPNEAISFIDIGGPTLLRGAAKNFQSVYALADPADYDDVLKAIKTSKAHDLDLAQKLAAKVFSLTASYDALIAQALNPLAAIESAKIELFPKNFELHLRKTRTLRYGENPDQGAAVYAPSGQAAGFSLAKTQEGKELSFNNFLDAEAAWEIVSSFSSGLAASVVKHGNPCGAAAVLNKKAPEGRANICKKALAGDPKSAFGGVFAANFEIDEGCATLLKPLFLEIVIAPSFSDAATKILATKTQLRIVTMPQRESLAAPELEWRQINGAFLVQEKMRVPTRLGPDHGQWVACPEKRSPDLEDELHFAQVIAARVHSNAIVLSKDLMVLGVGAGQMSRVDAMELALKKAKENGHLVKGSVCASDAFFPFEDCVLLAGNAGISGIIQPGGSKRDNESIDAAKKQNIAMVLTGERRFKH